MLMKTPGKKRYDFFHQKIRVLLPALNNRPTEPGGIPAPSRCNTPSTINFPNKSKD